MRDVRGCAGVPGDVALMLLACVGPAAAYEPTKDDAPAESRSAPAVAARAKSHHAAMRQAIIAETPTGTAPPRTARAGTDALSPAPHLAPTAGAVNAQPSSVDPPSPYSAVGYLEQNGVRMAVLARGDQILLKKQGDDVGSEFRLAVVDPPALLHLPTGKVVQVRRQIEKAAAGGTTPAVAGARSPDQIIVRTSENVAPIETTSPTEFEAALARALGAP